MKTILDIPDSVHREFKVKTAQNDDFRDAGIAEPFENAFQLALPSTRKSHHDVRP